jgi:GNAT superfamily N-acetyltransferase
MYPMPAIITSEPPDSTDACQLIDELQLHLMPQYPAGSRHGFSVQQLIEQQVDFFVLRTDGQAAGCGGLKFVGTEYAELKRMYVRPQFRGAGFGRLILDHLSAHARVHGVTLLRLETGIHQLAAIRLYESYGFRRIPAFGPYQYDPVSQFFEKRLAPATDP